MLTASRDNTVRIWDVATGQALVRFTGHTGGVTSAVWSQDDSRVLTSSADNTAGILYTQIAHLLAAACTWTPRNLTQRELDVYREGDYHPTCPNAPIPPDVIDAIKAKATDQIRAGQVLSSIQDLEQLNRWLQGNGQFKTFGVDIQALVAEVAATATVEALRSPTVTPLPKVTLPPP